MILYITKLEKGNIGADMHCKALCDIFGRENIFFINLSPIERERRLKNYISYGKYKTVLDDLSRRCRSCKGQLQENAGEWCV